MKNQISFASAEDCARAFYDAFARREIEAIMATWSEDDEIVCGHPGAAPLYGYAAIRAAWDAIFRNNDAMRVEVKDEHWHITVGMAIQFAIEWIYVGDEAQPRGPVFATNTFLRTPLGWRMLSHTAAPIQAGLPMRGGQEVVLH